VNDKEFEEELECELEPLGTQTAGITNVSFTVTNMPPGRHFRVDGTTVLGGFSFMVR
jgi:macrophage-stimulating 1 receptor